MEDQVKVARKAYTTLLKYCHPKVDEWPNDLLDQLNQAHSNLVKCVKESKHSVFNTTHKTENGWTTERAYYRGDLSEVDLSSDWRFKAVEGKRKQAEFIGFYYGSFPVNNPVLIA